MSKGSARRKGEGYTEGWDRIFGKQEPKTADPTSKTCKHCEYWAKSMSFSRLESCQNVMIFNMLDADMASEFQPPANFGCSLWSPK